MRVAAPRPNIALHLLQNNHKTLQRGRIESMRNFDPSPVGQLHPQCSATVDRTSSRRRGAVDQLHREYPVLHPSDEDLSLGTPVRRSLRRCRLMLPCAATPAIDRKSTRLNSSHLVI